MQEYIYEFENDSFKYEPTKEELSDAIKDIVQSECNVKIIKRQSATTDVEKILNYFVDELAILDGLEYNLFKDLKEYFEDIAREEHKANILDKQDRNDWYGTKQNVIGV